MKQTFIKKNWNYVKIYLILDCNHICVTENTIFQMNKILADAYNEKLIDLKFKKKIEESQRITKNKAIKINENKQGEDKNEGINIKLFLIF